MSFLKETKLLTFRSSVQEFHPAPNRFPGFHRNVRRVGNVIVSSRSSSLRGSVVSLCDDFRGFAFSAIAIRMLRTRIAGQ